jgi:hypothetical protein
MALLKQSSRLENLIAVKATHLDPGHEMSLHLLNVGANGIAFITTVSQLSLTFINKS